MKTLKKIALAALAMVVLNQSQAQKEDWGSDSVECRKCISLYAEPLKQKNYDESLIHWRCVIKVCPKYKESIYINGAILYRHKIDNEKDKAAKEKYIDTLAWLYEKQMEYFGRNAQTLERYGNDMLKYRQSDPVKSYALFKEIIDSEKENSSCVSVFRYYQSMVLLWNKKEEGFDDAKLVEEYFKCREYMDAFMGANKNDKNCPTLSEELDKLAMNFMKCENLVPSLGKTYEKLPAEKDKRLPELKKIASMLDKKGCTDSELFEKVSEELYKLEPSHEAAYNIAISKLNKKKYSEANTYFKEAIDQCNGCEKLGDYLIGAAKANYNAGSYSSAASYAKQAIAKGVNVGEAYEIIAQSIAATDCGANDFERKAKYWLACDYAKKSGNSALFSRYRANCPSRTEIFDRGLIDKATFSIGCWMNEEATIYKD